MIACGADGYRGGHKWLCLSVIFCLFKKIMKFVNPEWEIHDCFIIWIFFSFLKMFSKKGRGEYILIWEHAIFRNWGKAGWKGGSYRKSGICGQQGGGCC